MPHRILIVDDEKISMSVIKFALAEKRYDILLAADGFEALKMVTDFEPHLILLDIAMPKMNGYEFIKELKRLQGTSTTPVIVLTVNETMEGMLQLEGIKGYFVKPVDHRKLVSKIVECLGPNTID